MAPATDRPPIVDADLCVVGAGILGLAHAHEARRRGLRVVVVERHERAVGASVRNFGHVFVTAVAGDEAIACATRSRARWLELGRRAGLDVIEAGTLIVARDADEREVLESASRTLPRDVDLLGPAEAGRIAPIPTGDLTGALHCREDLRVDPRAAVSRLAELLEQDPDARIVWGSRVGAVEPGRVDSARAVVRAPMTVVCPGPDLASLPDDLRAGLEDVTLCRLQMLRVAAPGGGRRYAPALVTGLSLVRYPAFSGQPAAARVRARLAAERPELLAAGIHLLVTQLPDGDLIVGDTHEYGDTVSPFSDERLDDLLRGEAQKLLGAGELRVRERWQGVYPSAAADPLRVTAPLPGVRVVQILSGLGMTLGFGLAQPVLDSLTGGGPIPDPAARPRPTAAAPGGSGS